MRAAVVVSSFRPGCDRPSSTHRRPGPQASTGRRTSPSESLRHIKAQVGHSQPDLVTQPADVRSQPEAISGADDLLVARDRQSARRLHCNRAVPGYRQGTTPWQPPLAQV